jgi:hypothetical protein
MQYHVAKIEDTVLAQLGGIDFDNGRAWKRSDFDVQRLSFVQRPARRPDRTVKPRRDRLTADGRDGRQPDPATSGRP